MAPLILGATNFGVGATNGATNFSILKKVIFCDSNEIFDHGTFRSIKGNLRTDWHVGDIPHLGITLFWGKNKALYSYDGKTAKRMTDTPIARGVMTVFPDKKRAFYSAVDGKIYEFLFADEKLRVLDMNVPNGEIFTKLFSFTGDDNIYVFIRQGIYIWSNEKLREFWKSANPIGLTEHMSPDHISGLKGVLFTTNDNSFNTEKLYKLGKCETNH